MEVKKGVLDFGWLQYPYQYIDVSCTNEQSEDIHDFAEKVYEKRKKVYKKRQQSDLDTIVNQIASSKCFEFMVYNYIRDTIPPELSVEPPSLEIYGRYEVAFDNDLEIKSEEGTLGVHIKSQDIARIDANFPISFAFQKIDDLFLRKLENILVLGLYKDRNNGMLLSQGLVKDFKEFLKPPILSRLSDKEFIYYDVNKPAFRLED